jgi:hypothetical protein
VLIPVPAGWLALRLHPELRSIAPKICHTAIKLKRQLIEVYDC